MQSHHIAGYDLAAAKERFMKPTSLISAVTALAVFSGMLVSTASGNSSPINQDYSSVVGRTIQMAMHDDMNMGGAGMMGPGMQSPTPPMPGAQGSGMQGQNAPVPGTPGTGMPGMDMPDMGMQGMGRQGPGMQGQDMQGYGPMGSMTELPTDRLEGRIAFLHAELQITEAQMPVWNEFADVLRTSAKRTAEAGTPNPERPATSAVDHLDNHERWLTARLESVRALKAAYTKLYAALDDHQKKTADQLVTHQMGIH
jgi:hypothetical protein